MTPNINVDYSSEEVRLCCSPLVGASGRDYSKRGECYRGVVGSSSKLCLSSVNPVHHFTQFDDELQ